MSVTSMRTIGLTILFFLLSAGRTFLADDHVTPSYRAGNKKLAFNFPVIHAANTKKNPLGIDTAELKKSSWYDQVIKKIEESEYEINYDESTRRYASPNRKQSLRAFYTADQFTLLPRHDSVDKWKLTLQLKGIYAGADKLYAAANDPVVTQNGNSIQFNHNNEFITEYINSQEGIRQNFIISKKPADPCSQITVQISANKGWYINKVHDKELHFAKREGDQLSKKIIYNSLKVWDATHKELAARFVVNEKHSGFEIEVSTVDAVYPVTIDPLSTTPAITLNGANPNDYFGTSVASAGDVNGDGYSDVIVGAPGVSSNTGKAYLFMGSATGLSGSPAVTLNGITAGDHFGYSVASAGDVNGDGYADVVVGAYGVSSSQGAAYIFLGGIGGLSSVATTTLSGITAGDLFGWSVASAGDVNGDGYSDVVVGAWHVGTFVGAAYVFQGGIAGLSAIPTTILSGISVEDRFGWSVASAGDVNGDGFSDVIVGAPGGAVVGKVRLFLGSGIGVSAVPTTILVGLGISDSFGASVASAGDVNGDGYSDVIVGAYGVSSNKGAAYLFLGNSTGLATSPATTMSGISPGDSFGVSVACAGDVNGDGYSDVIVGAQIVGPSSTGAAYIFLGASTGIPISPSITLSGLAVSGSFGNCVASAGDVNGDGYSDVIAGAPNLTTNTGAAYPYHGGPDGLKTISNWQTESDQANAYYGISVASAGDVNSDGYSDVIVGAYLFTTNFSQDGKAYLYLGSPTGLSTTASWTAIGTMTAEYFGRCVSSAGDVNGDGYGDVLVGAYGYSNVQSQEGRVYLYYGSPGGLATSAAWTYESNVAGAILGASLAGAGDVNGDGYGDILIGAPQFQNGEANEGKVYLFYGSPTIPASTPDWSVESNQVGANYGVSVAGLGDVNGDGYSDIIVGAFLYDDGFTDEGKVFAYYGSPAGLPATPNWSAKGGQTNAYFGISVASAGDVNGDGFSDAIVGAYSYDVDKGAAFVYYGSSSGLSVAANWTAENNLSSTLFGYSVSSAGDVNGDGYSDVLVGARNYSNGQANEGALYAYYGSATGLSLTSSWFVESNNAGILLGNSVAPAGDINGDGYSDVIAGAPFYANPQSFEGAAFVYFGNNNSGLRNNLRLFNSDTTTPIQQANMSDPNLFGAGLYAKSFIGKQKGKLVWQTVRNGNPFSGNPITNSTFFTSATPAFTDLTLTGKELKDRIAKQTPTKATYIRARVKYDPTTAITGQVYGPWRYPEGFLRGRRDIGSVALPVKFISFVALKQNADVLLKWITTDETPGINYQVEHSVDGIHFSVIGTVMGFNNSQNEYQWLHTTPVDGKNYYRIRAVENGKDAFSVIRQVNFSSSIHATVYPNPVKSGAPFTVELTNSPGPGSMNIELFTIHGQKKAEYIIAAGNNTIHITLPELPAGQYILKVINENRLMYSGSLIVVK